ncbi:MAG TPA: hypothetical protein VFH73_09955, partial [Polyangia bacterium]|nr:hypothetical protein [Polyangia bacterium]
VTLQVGLSLSMLPSVEAPKAYQAQTRHAKFHTVRQLLDISCGQIFCQTAPWDAQRPGAR